MRTSVPVEPCGKIMQSRRRHHLERLVAGQRKVHGMWDCTESSSALQLLIKLVNGEFKKFEQLLKSEIMLTFGQEGVKVTEFKVLFNRPNF